MRGDDHRRYLAAAEREYRIRPETPHGVRCYLRGWAWVYAVLVVGALAAAVSAFVLGDLDAAWLRALVALAALLAVVEAARANVADEERQVVAHHLSVLLHGARRREDGPVLERLWDHMVQAANDEEDQL